MTLLPRHTQSTTLAPLPRAEGSLHISSKALEKRSVLDRFRPSGCMKALFPNRPDRLEAIIINSSGGLTAGDRLSIDATVGQGSHMVLTTQAAERAYRASGGFGQVDTRITVEDRATLHWLPQELILFNGAGLRRSLKIDLADTARLLMVEPVIFGRTAMGERVTDGAFHDRIDIYRNHQPLYRDAVRLDGNIDSKLAQIAISGGAVTMASVVYIAPDAEGHLDPIRAALPDTAGATLLRSDMLVLRLVAAGSHLLRRDLLPVLDRLSRNTLPTSWRL